VNVKMTELKKLDDKRVNAFLRCAKFR